MHFAKYNPKVKYYYITSKRNVIFLFQLCNCYTIFFLYENILICSFNSTLLEVNYYFVMSSEIVGLFLMVIRASSCASQ